ncbi:MAG: 2-amino-4-hydroxy-6-hydroxymethyldihydropteridine diphosphokinase, partial [Planctomycetes bacterium]|nr:2-amino-4-hydroxy-6-hydroxymethyldihydropteridine diphosphokinase [Planctomycetota bacterium]
MTPVVVHVGLGSNVGDRDAHLRAAVAALGATRGIGGGGLSSVREGALVGDGPPQGPFLNAVVELRTTLAPAALLGVCLAIEQARGRERPAPKNSPRPLDLDILAYGSARIDRRDLVVPHREWANREFVTAPLAELGVDTGAWPQLERP